MLRGGHAHDRQSGSSKSARESLDEYPLAILSIRGVMDPVRLHQIPLFADLSHREARALARHADEVDLPEGAKLVEKGDLAYELFFILDGKVEVMDGDSKIAELGPGDVVGEIGVLKTHTRTATVVATTPVRAIVMYGPEFLALEHEMPEVFASLQDLVRRRLAENG